MLCLGGWCRLKDLVEVQEVVFGRLVLVGGSGGSAGGCVWEAGVGYRIWWKC